MKKYVFKYMSLENCPAILIMCQLLFLIFFGTPGGAVALTSTTHSLAWTPPLLCETGHCSPLQKEISRRFFLSTLLDKVLFGQEVYSGSCYHTGHGMNPNHEHHGVVFFDYVKGEPYFGGEFSFFTKTNPYQKWTPHQARENFSRRWGKSHQLQTEEHYARVIFRVADPVWVYWFAQDPSNQHVYLQAVWGKNYFLMCELAPNSGFSSPWNE